ncbi:hypothetical protein D9M71_704030 [compost metagenome]
MDVDHAALAVGGDDHETVAVLWFLVRELADAGAQGWLTVPPANEVGLLLWTAFVHPLIPAIDRAERPVRPDRAEVGPMGDLLGSGIDRRRLVGGPMRTPAPANLLGQQCVSRDIQYLNPRRWRDVVPGR